MGTLLISSMLYGSHDTHVFKSVLAILQFVQCVAMLWNYLLENGYYGYGY